MSLNSIVQNNTIEAYLRMKSMGFDKPWWEIRLSRLGSTHRFKVRKWQRILDAQGNAVGYVSPDLHCPFSGGMIVRHK